jgi:hypothetical protein
MLTYKTRVIHGVGTVLHAVPRYIPIPSRTLRWRFLPFVLVPQSQKYVYVCTRFSSFPFAS